MKYPDDASIRVGDLIWWNEGNCVGYVQQVAESKEAYVSWGLDAPCIFVSNTHPFDPQMHTGVCYDESVLEDEGIGLLTFEERVQLERATFQAHERVAADLEYSTYSVFTDVLDGKLVGWVFAFSKDDGTELTRITVPARH